MIMRSPDACRCEDCEASHRALCKFDCGSIDRAMLDTLLAMRKCKRKLLKGR